MLYQILIIPAYALGKEKVEYLLHHMKHLHELNHYLF